MLYSSTILTYPILLILSIGKRSFENMGLLIGKSGDSVRRLLQPTEYNFELMQCICQSTFKSKKVLYVGIDDTLIKKIHSKFMQGAGMFFDTKIGRRIMAYRLTIGIITDGTLIFPIDCAYIFAKELLDEIDEKFPSKDEIAISFIKTAKKLFPEMKLIFVVDGLYTTVNLLRWCKSENINLEARMHSNRIVKYKNKKIKVKDLLFEKGLQPKGRQEARTIQVVWHDIELELTIVRRFDKGGNESFVFQVATYHAKPLTHALNYKKRWKVEMLNRTTKQELGLQECFSRKLETQYRHVSAVLLAYALAQLERKVSKLNNTEQAIRRLETRTVDFLKDRFYRFLHNKLGIYE